MVAIVEPGALESASEIAAAETRSTHVLIFSKVRLKKEKE